MTAESSAMPEAASTLVRRHSAMQSIINDGVARALCAGQLKPGDLGTVDKVDDFFA